MTIMYDIQELLRKTQHDVLMMIHAHVDAETQNLRQERNLAQDRASNAEREKSSALNQLTKVCNELDLLKVEHAADKQRHEKEIQNLREANLQLIRERNAVVLDHSAPHPPQEEGWVIYDREDDDFGGTNRWSRGHAKVIPFKTEGEAWEKISHFSPVLQRAMCVVPIRWAESLSRKKSGRHGMNGQEETEVLK